MRQSIVLFVLASIVSVLAVGCMPNATRGAVAFVPRVYPYVPELGPGPGK